MKRRRTGAEIGGIELSEQAVTLLRRAPAGTWLSYYVGTLPFVLGLLYFWSDMSRGAFAAGRCAAAALGLSLLFLWMKCWQAAFCANLRSLTGSQQQAAPWTAARIARLTLVQTLLQPAGLLSIPLSLAAMAPFAWIYAYYQNLTVCGTGEDLDTSRLRRRAWSLAQLWPQQNHIAIWILSPWLAAVGLGFAFGLGWFATGFFAASGYVDPFVWFVTSLLIILLVVWPCSPLGFVIAANVAIAMVLVPSLLRSFLGFESVFTLSSAYSIANTTFLAILYAVVYLCMDPLAKAAYVLRCFYGQSITTGEDLRTELRGLRASRAAAIAAISLLLFSVAAFAKSPLPAEPSKPAQDFAVAPANLDRSIAQVLEREEFRWRMPRINPKPDDGAEPGFFGTFFRQAGEVAMELMKKLGRGIAKILRWLDKHFFSKLRWNPPAQSTGNGWSTWPQVMLYLLIAVVLSILGIWLWRNRWRLRTAAPVASQALPVVDLESEDISAADMPADEWMNLAADLLRRGEYRLAIRALFLSSLAQLAQQGVVRLASFKSNRDYITDIQRKAHSLPGVLEAFGENVRVFDRIWYGQHAATVELVAGFEDNLRRIRSHALQP